MDTILADDPELMAILGMIEPPSSSSTSSTSIHLEPNLDNIISDQKLKFVFVGGKGGVGKTTVSSSLAIAIAKQRGSHHRILLVSTDPAHSLSDAFDQKFNSIPSKVNDMDNLFVMETDVSSSFKLIEDQQNSSTLSSLLSSFIHFPGIDEAIGFSNLMKMVETESFSCIIFDTAPTGHTLHFLAMPKTLKNTFQSISQLTSSFGGLFNMFSSMFNIGDNVNISEHIDKFKDSAQHTSEMMSNPQLTQFICVCTPGKLPLYETERLVQKLAEFNISTKNIVVNQVASEIENSLSELQSFKNRSDVSPFMKQFLAFYSTRLTTQKKFLDHIRVLYPSHSSNSDILKPFHVTKLPLLDREVRGVPSLLEFSKKLLGE